MSYAPGPWPDPRQLATLASAAARPFEELWLGWLDAIQVEGLFHESPAHKLPAWLTPSTVNLPTTRWLEARATPLLARRRSILWLPEGLLQPPMLVPMEQPCCLPRLPPLPSATEVSQVLPLLRNWSRDSATWIEPLDEAGNLRPEAVVLCLPVQACVLLSVGTHVHLRLVEPHAWVGTSIQVEVPREQARPLLNRLPGTTAADWAAAWDVLRRDLRSDSHIASPQRVLADGPELPIRLTSAEKVRLGNTWVAAGSGPLRALAKVVSWQPAATGGR